MKNLSAKLKLTILNSLLMLLMAVIVVALLFSFSDNIVTTNSKSQLMKVVAENADEPEFDDGMLEVDDVDFFKDGVYTILYTENGELIYGEYPDGYSGNVSLKNKQISEVTVDGALYYIYDELITVEDSSRSIWMRGAIAVDEVAGAANTVLQIALISLPFLIIIGTLGCYFIVKIIFRPIEKIVKTAEDISKSEDLSLRINLDSSSEELYNLASTFDSMLDRLESAFESEKQFSQNVSHELRTPTAVILAQCEYALGKKATVEDKQEALEVVFKQTSRMSGLISELLNLMRLERKIEKPEMATVNFAEIVALVCAEQSAVATQNITLSRDIAADVMLFGNQTMLIRLVVNLLSNAYRYGKEGGNVNVVLKETPKEIALTVEDDGIGIAHEHKDKIWQRFYQVESARSADRSGSMGLGLSMVWQIAKVHRAHIQVDSEPGKGSRFTVIFPKN